jgi:hypothetical protein
MEILNIKSLSIIVRKVCKIISSARHEIGIIDELEEEFKTNITGSEITTTM